MRLLLLLPVFVFSLHAQDVHDLATLRYTDLHVGTGAPAAAGKRFTVHYTGWLKDGTKFDSSRDRSEPFKFVQGRRQVITGWDVGFEGMKVGGTRKLIIPYQFAYGEAGTGGIPPKAELTFEVELLNVEDVGPFVPALDLIVPWKELEARALKLNVAAHQPGSVLAKYLARICQLNAAYLKGADADAPTVSEPLIAATDELLDIPDSFAAVRKELEAARNGSLVADATWMDRPTTRRGLFTALVGAVAEQIALAENRK